jgi:hypothetical protein
LAVLQRDIESEIRLGVVRLEREATLLAMDIALNVQIIDLLDAEQ